MTILAYFSTNSAGQEGIAARSTKSIQLHSIQFIDKRWIFPYHPLVAEFFKEVKKWQLI